MKEYKNFVVYCEERGFEFPCTADQFIARAAVYAAGDEELIDRLCCQGS